MNLISRAIENVVEGGIYSVIAVVFIACILIITVFAMFAGQISTGNFVAVQSIGLALILVVAFQGDYKWNEIDEFHIPYENYVMEKGIDIT